jgi:hypothetical protein
MENIVEVTNSVDFGFNDEELLPVTKCVCGKKFIPWEFSIGLWEEGAAECPECGRMMFFSVEIRVYEVNND